MSSRYFSTGIKSIDDLLERKGFSYGDWIGVVGEPGSMKSLIALTASGEWIQNDDNQKNSVILVLTETHERAVINQLLALNYHAGEMIDSGRLVIIDAFLGKSIDTRTESIVNAVNRRAEMLRKKFGHDCNILLVIDSISPLWGDRAVMAGKYFAEVSKGLRLVVDLCFTTAQINVDGRAFGRAMEHWVDSIIRTGIMEQDGEKRKWIKVEKTRGQSHNSKFHYLTVDEKTKEIYLDGTFSIKGRFKDTHEALESLKYDRSSRIQETRNSLISKQNKMLSQQLEEQKSMNKALIDIIERLSEIYGNEKNTISPEPSKTGVF
jgi:KaiC/GvpD/RAD55 family RecA-like ATPase